MDDLNLLSTLGQVSSDQVSAVFQQHLRGAVIEMISGVMAEEVASLCGEKHRPGSGEYFRAGSSPGRVIYEGDREQVVRPRVRRRGEDGHTSEVQLETYRAASDSAQLKASIVEALIAGVSTRDVANVQGEKSPGVSKSNVSRHWQTVGHQFVDRLRGVDLSTQNWVVLMLDGIRLSKEQTAIVAIGISADGQKHVLDFDLGSTENAEVCRSLMRRLMSCLKDRHVLKQPQV